jgi:hypothetical protein
MDAGVRAGVTIEPPRAKESLGAAAICPAPVGVFIFDFLAMPRELRDARTAH